MPATFDDARMMPTRERQIFFCHMWAPSDDAQMMPTRKNAVYIVKMNRKFFSIRQFLTPKITCGVLLANSCMWGTFVNSAIVACGVLLAKNGGFLLLKFRKNVLAKIIHIFSLKPCSGILTAIND